MKRARAVPPSREESSAHGEKVAAVRLSIASNTLLILLKLGVGLWSSSVSVLAEAAHSGMDLIAALVAAYGVRKASRPPDSTHPFGHGKFENLSGVVEALLILAVAGGIVVESVRKLIHGVHISYVPVAMGVMALSAGLNAAVSRRLMQVARKTDSIALEADALHLRTDVYTSLGVFGALALILLSDIFIQAPRWRELLAYLDPMAAMVVALLIVRAGLELTRRAMAGLLDRPLPEEEDRVIRDVLKEFDGHILEFHDLRHRKAGSERHIDLHLVMARDASLDRVHALCDEIERKIQRRLPRSRVLIHVEPCDRNCPACRGMEGCETPPEDINPP